MPNVEPSFVEKTEGEPVQILCSFGRPLERCRFTLAGENGFDVKLNPAIERTDNFRYFGEGFDKGQCGLRISNLKREHEGNWTCRLDLGDAYDDVVGHFQVLIARAPTQPQLIVQGQKQLREGDELNAECSFRDGRPSAIVRWFLGDNEITSHDESLTEQNGAEVVISSLHKYYLIASDNLKSLVCRVEHAAFENNFTNTSLQLQVNYPPQALGRDELKIGGLTIGSSADVQVTIRSNPRPFLEWTIDGIKMKEGTQNQRYVVKNAEQVEEGRYLAQLTVIQLTLEDTLKTYNLRASNEFGHQDYQISIGGSPDDNGNIELSSKSTLI